MKSRCRGVKSGSRRSEELANARNEDCALRAQNEELALLVDKKWPLARLFFNTRTYFPDAEYTSLVRTPYLDR